MNRITRSTILVAASTAIATATAQDPSASISFVTADPIEAGTTITIDVVCDSDTQGDGDGLFGAPGLYLFACESVVTTGPTQNTGSISLNPGFPFLQVPGRFEGTNEILNIAGCVGNNPAAPGDTVTLFSFQQQIDANAADGTDISFTFSGAVVFDAGGGLLTAATSTPRSYDLASASGTLTVGDGVASACNEADLALPYEVLDLSDINAFLAAFQTNNPVVDYDDNGVFDLSDINVFVNAFLSGCP